MLLTCAGCGARLRVDRAWFFARLLAGHPRVSCSSGVVPLGWADKEAG